MNCLYLIQTSDELPHALACLKSRNKIILSWKTQTEDTNIFFPNSTWTTGRNKLREYVINNNLTDYDWYIFLDWDITFTNSEITEYSARQNNGFRVYENTLNTITNNKLDFQICLPWLADYHPQTPPKDKNEELTRIEFWFDAIFNGFSNEIFFGDKIFPYDPTYDSDSWWTSQYILLLYCKWQNIKVARINNLKIKNPVHSNYPRKWNFDDVRTEIQEKFEKRFFKIN